MTWSPFFFRGEEIIIQQYRLKKTVIVENNKVKLVTQELIAQPKDNTFAEKIHRVLATELLDSEEIYDGGQIKVSPDNDQPRLVAARQNKEEVELETRVVLVSDHNRMETQKKQCNKKIEEENIDDRLTLEDKKRSSYNVSSMSESKMEAETSMMMMKMAITKSLIQQAGGVKRSIVVICSSRINVVNTTTTLFGASTIHDFQDSIKVDDRNGGESELRDVVVVMDLAGHQLQPNPTLQTVSPSSMPISHTARGLLEYLADEEVKQVLKMVNMIEDNNIDGKSDNSCGFCCDSDSAVSVTSCELKITTTTTADNNTVVEVEHQNTGKSVECWKSNARSRDSCSAGGGGRRGGGGGKGAKYLPLPMMQRIPLLLLQNYALSTFAGLFNYCLAANHRAEDVVVVAEEEEEDYEMDEEEEGDASAPHSSTINEEESFKNLSESPIQQLQRILDNRYENITKIGAGGCATVFSANKLDSGIKVVLKFLSREYRLVTHGASGERIPFEALLLHRYRNASSIIGMVEWYHDPLDPAAFVIVQDYDESDDSMDVSTLLNELFNESITRRGGNLKGLSIEYIQEIFYKTVYALKPLHEKGIIHGDVKDANIIFNRATRELTLIDLGLAGKMTGMRRSKRFTGTYRDLTVYTKTNYSKELNEVHHLGVLLWALLTTGSTETFHSEAGVRRFHDAFDLEGIRKRLSTEEWSESLQLLIWAYEAIAVMLTKDEAGRVSLSEMCELDFLKPENQCRK